MKVDVKHWVGDPSIWNKILREGEFATKQDIEGESYAEIMINSGLNLIAGDNNRMAGWNKFRELLSPAPDGAPWFRVFKTCYNTIKTIPTLVYDETKFEDLDSDGDDHIADACRYFFMSRPSPIYEKKEKAPNLIQRYKAHALAGKGRFEAEGF